MTSLHVIFTLGPLAQLKIVTTPMLVTLVRWSIHREQPLFQTQLTSAAALKFTASCEAYDSVINFSNCKTSSLLGTKLWAWEQILWLFQFN